MRIGVAATAPFGADVLERLARRHDVGFLLTRPDAPRGRGRKLAPPPAKEVAERLGIPVLQPERPGDEELPEADAIVVAAYGLLIPEGLLDRAPVERAIMAGDTETGVTIHETVKALDAGPVAARRAFPIAPDDDAGAVFSRSAEVAADLLGDVLPAPSFEPQPEEGVTYADKIGPDDRRLDLSEPEQAERTVRALSPHIGAWAELHGRRVTIWRAHVEDGELVPDEVQPEGKRRMTYAEFLRGIR
jgi:methionyl-tRNA formyltransferase